MKLRDLITEEYNLRYTRNWVRGERDLCDICGKVLKVRKHFVWEAADGLVPVAADVTYDERVHSTVYVGSECARKLKGYVRTD